MKLMIPITASLHKLISLIIFSPRHVLFFKLMPLISSFLRSKLRLLIADMLELIYSNPKRHKGNGIL